MAGLFPDLEVVAHGCRGDREYIANFGLQLYHDYNYLDILGLVLGELVSLEMPKLPSKLTW